MIQKQSIIIVVSPPPGVFLLPACWRPYGWRSLPRPLPEQTVSRPVGGGGRWWSVQLAGPVVTRQPEAPPPRRESQGRDELTERERETGDVSCFLSCFLASFPQCFLSPFLSPLPLLLCLYLWSCEDEEEGGGGLVGTAAVAPAGGWLTGVVGAGLMLGGGVENKALAEGDKHTRLI